MPSKNEIMKGSASISKALCYLLPVFLLAGCSGQQRNSPALFTPVAGIAFTNTIPENDSINIIAHEYLYNGGGVGVGDFDRDGRPDLVFSGNLVSSALFLQRNKWAFDDVTKAAGLTTTVWCAGVNVSDFDGNGWEDIYFATLNLSGADDTPNLLFLNEGIDQRGIPRFREAAAEFGLDDTGYCTHSAWFDYENDGDLDLYVLNNAIENYNRNVAKGTDTTGRGKSGDRVYLNSLSSGPSPGERGNGSDGLNGAGGTDGSNGAEPYWTPQAIKTEGWGLGVGVQDFNQDGYADIYVANDFLSNDFLLINQRGEGFRDELRQRTGHQSRNAMGVDVADLNGDGAPEIMVVDMLPDDNLRQKTMFGDVPHQGHRMEVERGYAKQFVRNTLQLNNGNGKFADVAFQAGVASTDWSWTPLLADFDNDGDRDIFVSNGYPKDITNKDFIDFNKQSNMFGTRQKQLESVTESLREVSGVHQPNYFFRNDGDLRFSQPGGDWLPQVPSYSNGAVFVDLDGDGDLDLVTNNINEPAGIFRNHSRERDTVSTNYHQLLLKGPPGNTDALGTKVWLYTADETIYHEHYRQRGYLSTVDQLIHFGLHQSIRVDSLIVRFPDGRGVRLRDLAANQVTEVGWNPALPTFTAPAAAPKKIPVELKGGPVHQESFYSDFDEYALAVRDNSHDGPAMTALDLDDDGMDELVFGGAAGQPVSVWKQDEGALTQVQTLDETSASEATVLRVIEKETGDLLYVGNGSSEFGKKEMLLKDMVYAVKNGRLELLADPMSLPLGMTSAVVQLRNDRETQEHLFIGRRMAAGAYPRAAPSVLIAPSGDAEELDFGMVIDAVAGDFNGDGYADLAVVGEFEPVRICLGSTEGLKEAQKLPATSGWYYSLTGIDLDGDGDLDLVAGNVGLNTPYQATADQPMVLYADDFDDNGAIDPILTTFNGTRAYPVAPRNTLARQVPTLKRQFPDFATYGDYSAAKLPPLSGDGFQLTAVELRSLYLENDGSGNFTVCPLPALAQTAPLRAAMPTTLPDGRTALVCVQNDYATEPLGGPFDGGNGFALTLAEDGSLEVITGYLDVRENARSLVRLRDGRGGSRVLVGVNGGVVRLLDLGQ